MPINALRSFFRLEAAGGICLVVAAVIAIVVANSPLQFLYQAFLDLTLQVRVGAVNVEKPLLLWINDGLMAVFFLFVGLEVKRELKAGELSTREQAMLPGIAAIGGMVVPALIYVLVNLGGDADNLNGWAIPAATDIAFALGVLTLLGRRVPLSLKVLLTAIAIFDDIGAIIIIALFYTADLSVVSLVGGAAALAALVVLNLAGVTRKAPYFVIGAVLWLFVLKSGVHATLAGVALAMTIPMTARVSDGQSPLHDIEHGLHRWVAFGVLPIFAFANAGVSFAGMGYYSLVEPVTLGIALGLAVGKPIGILGSIRLAGIAGLARAPQGVSWAQLLGMSVLCGIGFTMSLFIGGLAWEHGNFDAPVRLGVLSGSIVSAVVGAVILLLAPGAREPLPQAMEPVEPLPDASVPVGEIPAGTPPS
jgi:Na+:H+ antiporter, NhaA family